MAMTAGLCLAGGLAAADVVAPGAVEITGEGTIEAPLTAEPGDGYRGVLLFADPERAVCTDCHYNYDVAATGLEGDIGPALSLVGGKDSPARLRAILVDARAVFGEDTAMPAFYVADGDGETLLSAQEIEDLVAYLSELQESPR
jgi:sulfur-oxidizing protein SoxX